ncbi:MAG: hypothetical protein AAF985_02705 [Bacteroidota bacterium]
MAYFVIDFLKIYRNDDVALWSGIAYFQENGTASLDISQLTNGAYQLVLFTLEGKTLSQSFVVNKND